MLLHGLLPGEHLLRVTASDHAGLSTTVERRFRYAPSEYAIGRILVDLKARDDEGERLKAELIERFEAVTPKEDVGAVAHTVYQALMLGESHFEPFNVPALSAAFTYFAKHAARTIRVAILDKVPFFSAPEVNLRVGDTVVWKYDPATVGHQLPNNLHRIRVGSDDRTSPLLRAGETYAFRFEAPGEFIITNTKQPDARQLVRVSAR